MSGVSISGAKVRGPERPRQGRQAAKLRVLSMLDLHIRRRCAESELDRPAPNAPSPHGEGVCTG